jgi:hypothetical protein
LPPRRSDIPRTAAPKTTKTTKTRKPRPRKNRDEHPRGSPDHAYYRTLAAKRDGHNGKNPTLAVERKILRRCYHSLRDLGDAALALPVPQPQEVAA